MAYQGNLLGDFWTSYRQRRATGGRPLTAAETRGLMDPIASSEADKVIAAGERERQQANINRQFALQEQQIRDANRAATISGATQLLGLPIQGYLGYKVMQKSGLIGGGGGGMVPTAGATTAGAANAGIGATLPPASTYTTLGVANPAAPILDVPTSFASEAAAAETLGGPPSALGSASLLAPAAGGFLGGSLLGPTLDKILPGGGKTGKAVGGATAGFLTGATIGSFVPGIGTLVGGFIGGIGGFISGLF